jgi:arylsulfatase A-like enzyme
LPEPVNILLNMDTPQAIFGALILGLFLITASCTQKSSNVSVKTNIIYIMADDLGYGDVGFNGQTRIKTPEIDRMANQGMVFSQHYAGTSVCGPSRAVLMTGFHVGHATVKGNPAWTLSGNRVDMTDQDITVAKELKRAGYVNGMIGKWALDETFTTSHPLDMGFDYFFGFRTHMEAHSYYPSFIWRNREKVILEGNDPDKKLGKYSHDLLAEEALSFIRQNRDTSFFLYLAFTIPHNEITVPEDSKKPYLNLGWPERPMKPGHYKHDPEGNTTYAGMVSRMDSDVGRILDLLNELGIAENTLVIFTSDNGHGFDNGFFNSNGPFRGKKLTLYEGGIRVPFVTWWPGTVKAGTRTDHASAFWDFLPTACEIAGIEPKKKIDGISYLSTLLGKKENQAKHDYFYWEVNENDGPTQAILKRDWKGIKFYERPFELYNIKDDPAESHNLADQFPEIVSQMEELMISSRTEHPEFPLTKRKSNY